MTKNTNAEELFEVKQITDMRELFKIAEERYEDHPAFILKNKVNEEKLDYLQIGIKQFASEYKAVAEKLLQMGFLGKRIGIISENRYEWNVAYTALITGLAIAIPLDKSLPILELSNILERAKVEIIFASYKQLNNLFEIFRNFKLKGLNTPKIVLMDLYQTEKEVDQTLQVLKDEKLVKEFEIISMKTLLNEGLELRKTSNEFEKIKIDREEIAEILYTSATTSKSKGVMLSHKNICSNVRDIASMFDLGPEDRLLSFLPIHHSFECTVGFVYPIFAGSTICFADNLRKLAENLKEYKITAMISVPILLETVYSRIEKEIIKKGKLKQFEFGITISNTLRRIGIDKRKEIFKEIHDKLGGNLRLVVVGAAALVEETHKRLNEIGIIVYQGYGLTETSPVLSAGYAKSNVPGSVGKVLPSVEIKIDKTAEEQMGEILVKGPNVMIGYENDEENNKNAFTDSGYFRTGDLGYFDKDGNLFITGRAKNVIVLKNGKNIFPDESEVLLNKMDGVLETMVFGMPSEKDPTDVTLSAKIVYDEEFFKGKTKTEIHDEIWEQVKEINKIQPTYKYLKKIYISKNPLIKTTTLKIKRYEELEKIKEELQKEVENK